MNWRVQLEFFIGRVSLSRNKWFIRSSKRNVWPISTLYRGNYFCKKNKTKKKSLCLKPLKIKILYMYNNNEENLFLRLLSRINDQSNTFRINLSSFSRLFNIFFCTQQTFVFHVQEGFYIVCHSNAAYFYFLQKGFNTIREVFF